MGRRGYGGGGRGRLYTYRYTVTTRMTFALRWAAMRAILMFHNCEEQSQDSVHRPQLLKKKESRNGFEPKVPLLTSLTPYRWARPAHEAVRQGVLALYEAVRPIRLLHRHLRHSTRGDLWMQATGSWNFHSYSNWQWWYYRRRQHHSTSTLLLCFSLFSFSFRSSRGCGVWSRRIISELSCSEFDW